ncbi:MAG: adenylate kinase [Bacteroidales bacterium]|jgi:adenylate kinase|nr:adenylate kinase [Bacteroidales bacterium]
MEQHFNIVLLGAPGSGKGTQARLISEKYNLDHISTGELFRQEIASQSSIGRHVKEIIEKGNLCPDDLTLDMLVAHIDNYTNNNGFIFDGVPRTIDQAKMMDGIGYHKTISITIVIDIQVDKKEIINRITKRSQLEGRSDDVIHILKQRISNYFELTRPLENYYARQNKIRTVNGMQNVETVFNAICNILDTIQ